MTTWLQSLLNSFSAKPAISPALPDACSCLLYMHTFTELLILYKNKPKDLKLRTMTYMYGPNLLCGHVKLHITSPLVFAYMSTVWNTQFSYLSPSSNTTSSEKPFMVSKEIFFLWASIPQLPTSKWCILEPLVTGCTCRQLFVFLDSHLLSNSRIFLKHLFFLMYVTFPHYVDFPDYGEPEEMIYFILSGERTEAFARLPSFRGGNLIAL